MSEAEHNTFVLIFAITYGLLWSSLLTDTLNQRLTY